MKDMYHLAGISKQALWSHHRRKEADVAIIGQVVEVINDFRKGHKRMGCRTIYWATEKVLPVGRDKFEQIGFSNGFKLKLKRNPQKTTWGQRVEVHPNLIEGLTINNINQVWQSDIFYLDVEGKHYYGVTIEDIYSRKLLSLHLSTSMSARQTEAALKKAIKQRREHNLEGCIFHSDRGSQYISDVVKSLLKTEKMRISMCKMPQENAYVERIQGTLKHQYLYPHQPTAKTITSLARKTTRYYNDEKPHSNLGMKTPTAFENYVQNMSEDQRPKLEIFDGYSPQSTNKGSYSQKEKRSKKEKVYNTNNNNK